MTAAEKCDECEKYRTGKILYAPDLTRTIPFWFGLDDPDNTLWEEQEEEIRSWSRHPDTCRKCRDKLDKKMSIKGINPS